ncbi:SPW repeat protein [Algoriphagus sp. AGSA1]|uniref:SPW repeat protein n=1 Tax=Algoriphagus sp. AGSA1 TaxID=2907213 RepID=UPI001F3DE64F|nr:SPW repeat protein [Algoriphagus sp. AGSA1]MCE7054679.1 SPW repeat protein [Algoriphagus sp. AGSA1]
MNLISPKIHAYLDYSIAAILIGIPWIFGFTMNGPEMWIPVIIGLITLTYSIFTRFKEEHFGIIPLRVHVISDVILGAFLASSPWIAGFTKTSAIPHLVMGVLICAIAVLTDVPQKSDEEKGKKLE